MLKEGEKRQAQPGPPGGLQFSPPRWSHIPHDGQESPHAFHVPSQAQLGGNQLRGEVPRIEEVLPVLYQQTGYISQLEGENQFCNDELTQLKMRVAELAADNKRLHEELKRNVVQEILLDDGKLGPHSAAELPLTKDEEFQNVQSSPELQGRRLLFGKWQKELERIHTLHEAKTNRQEAQLNQAKDEAKRLEHEVQQLKAKMRTSESNQSGRGGFGLCITCAKNEAIVASPSKRHSEAIDRLTRERDELVDSLAHLKSRLEEMKQRENDSYDQVKKSIILVEQAGLEKTEALVHKEQLNDELANLRRRFEEHIAETQNKIAQERLVIRKEFQREIDDQNIRMKDLNEELGKCKVQLERALRERGELQSEVEQYKIQFKSYDTDYGQVQDSMKLQMTKASIERSAAIQNMDKLRTELQRLEHDRDQERSCHRSEVDDLRRRLTMAERDLMESKEECIYLTGTMQALERDAHFTKLSKESLEKGRNDDLKAMAERARVREEELGGYIEVLQEKFTRARADLEELLSKERNLVQKLTQECHSLTERLEKVNEKYKKETKSLQSENEQLTYKVRKMQKRTKDMEQQHVEHGRMHEKMRQQIKLMDEHAQSNATQVLDLLAQQTELMKDRQMLAKEVEFLRNQVTPYNASDVDKLFTTNKGKVENILDTLVMKEMEATTSDHPGTLNTLDL
ncbi:serologically defined colon cancer antigen 8 homolog isoform X2 [Lineus longissimus]